MFKRLIRYSNKIFNLFSIIDAITDQRIKPQIPTVKAVAAIIIMYFTNQGSLNSLSQEIAFKKLKADIPSISTIARVADTMDLDKIRDVGLEIYKKARAAKMLEPCHGMWVGVVDGHEQITSPYCKCKYCKKKDRYQKRRHKRYPVLPRVYCFYTGRAQGKLYFRYRAGIAKRRRDNKRIQAHREGMQKLSQSIFCGNR